MAYARRGDVPCGGLSMGYKASNQRHDPLGLSAIRAGTRVQHSVIDCKARYRQRRTGKMATVLKPIRYTARCRTGRHAVTPWRGNAIRPTIPDGRLKVMRRWCRGDAFRSASPIRELVDRVLMVSAGYHGGGRAGANRRRNDGSPRSARLFPSSIQEPAADMRALAYKNPCVFHQNP
jgi:hypothetical protein